MPTITVCASAKNARQLGSCRSGVPNDYGSMSLKVDGRDQSIEPEPR